MTDQKDERMKILDPPLEHFNIGHDRMPTEVYYAYGYVKRAAAGGQHHAGRLPAWKG